MNDADKGMTVGELIEKLKEFEPDLPVVCSGATEVLDGRPDRRGAKR